MTSPARATRAPARATTGVLTGPASAPERPFSPLVRGRRLAALIVKEARQIVRDPSSILIAFVLPLILLFLFGYGVSLDATRTRIGIVLESPSPSSRELAAAFQASPYFDARVGTDRRAFEEPLVQGAIGGIVVVPVTFDRDLRIRSKAPELQVIVDGSDPNTAALVQGYVQGVIAIWAGLRSVEAGREGGEAGGQERFWFNPARTSRFFLVPGSVAIVMALVGTLLTALVVAREWERGTIEALMATPVTRVELLAGKIVPYYLLGLASMALCTIVSVYLFDVPFRGSAFALFAISSAFLLPALGQGLLISAGTKNQFLASQLALLSSFLPTFVLSGFIFEIGSMPPVIQAICQIVPARWLIPSLQTVFLAGDLWPMFLKNIGVMVLYGLVFLALALRTTGKRLA
ncbi:MAG TPA: ABC transporter permease [Polyangiaceae bacterium]|nr:ABC transporter permease [Polyangiaceae bacterium]